MTKLLAALIASFVAVGAFAADAAPAPASAASAAKKVEHKAVAKAKDAASAASK